MAKVETRTARVRETVFKPKITPKDCGNPKQLLAMPESTQKLELGKIYGTIYKTGSRTMPNGDMFQYLDGMFRAVPNDESLDIVNSGVLYMPQGIHQMLASAVEKNEGASGVTFAFALVVYRANNPAGYSWGAMELLEASDSDPFAPIESRIASRKIAQIGHVK